LSKGLMIQDMEYGGLNLTSKAYAVFKGEKVSVSHILPETLPEKILPDEIPEYDRELFEILRKMRKKLADHTGVPPYVIFSDKTLIGMATFFPGNENELLQIHGIGAVKLEKYGKIFLDIIEEYRNKD